MKRCAILLMAALLTAPAIARDTVLNIPLADVLAMPEAQGKLNGSVKFYLAGQTTPKIIQESGEGITNRKTNGVGKEDEFGCKWAALSALISLQDAARRNGSNAVVNLVSYYKKNETKSDTTVECHAGGFVIGVTLKGTYATVAE